MTDSPGGHYAVRDLQGHVSSGYLTLFSEPSQM